MTVRKILVSEDLSIYLRTTSSIKNIINTLASAETSVIKMIKMSLVCIILYCFT